MVDKHEKDPSPGIGNTDWCGSFLRSTLLVFIVTSLLFGWPIEAQESAQEPPPESSGETENEESTRLADEGPVDEFGGRRDRGRGRRRRGSRRPQRRPEPKGLLRFEIPFSEESGGGSVTAFAEEVRQDAQIYELTGQVEIRYRNLILRADHAELDRERKMVVAFGNVILDQGAGRLAGATIRFDLENETGTLTEAKGYLSSDYYFRGSEIRKTGELTYTVMDGVFSSCEQDVPSWSFRAGRTDITVDGFAKTRNATLRVKKMPVFFIPYMAWPVSSDRSSGILVPKPGHSERRGSSVGLAYYQTLGRSADTTFFLDLFTEDYLGYGNELRYQPTPGTGGIFSGYAIEDPEYEDLRWKVNLLHRSDDLPFGMRGIVRFEDVSDFDFYRDFEREIRRNSRRQIYSTGFISGNWGRQSFNMLFDQRRTFLTDDAVVTLRQLPELEHKVRSTRIGNTPLYFQSRAAMHFLDVERNELYDESYYRAHLSPSLSLPLRAFPWLALNVRVGARYTFWSNSLRTNKERRDSDDGLAFRDESLERFLPTVLAEIIGPSFSRTFEGGGKRFARFKHVIEPRFSYVRNPVFEEQNRIPRFDEVDRLRAGETARYALVNRLLAKGTKEGATGREILSLEIYQLYSLDDRPLQQSLDRTIETKEGPWSARLRFIPNRGTLLRVETRYNTIFNRVESNSVSGTFSGGPYNFGLRWNNRVIADTGATARNQLRISAGLRTWQKKIRLGMAVTYDIEESLAIAQRYIIDYSGSCYGFLLAISEFSTLARPELLDREIRFSISLKNVGTFLDLTSGTRETL